MTQPGNRDGNRFESRSYCSVSERSGGRNSKGFALIDVVIASVIFAVAALGLCASMATGTRFTDNSRETLMAHDAVDSITAQIAQTDFAEVARRFYGTGFEVPGLRAAPGDADGLPGEVLFSKGPDDAPGSYRVTLRVNWRRGSDVHTLETGFLLANVRADTETPPPLSEVIAARLKVK